MEKNREKTLIEIAIEEAAKKRGITVEEAKQIAIDDANAERIPGDKISNLTADEAIQQIKDAGKKINKKRR